MKILWVKAGGLVPPDSGGKIRSYNILRQLARNHSITFFSFHDAHGNDAHGELADVFDRVVCLPLNLPAPKSLAEMKEYALHLFSREPYNISKFCRPEVRRELLHVLQQQPYDLILCDFVIAAGAIPWDWPCPKVLFTHNVEAEIWRRHYGIAKNPLWKALSRREWRRMQAAERRYLQLADHVLTVSENDRDFFAQFLNPEELTVIPTGVDVEYFQPQAAEEIPDSIAFTGSMDWLPNEDAILYFIEEIFPLVRRQIPDASLCVVGRKPSSRLQALREMNKNLQITGWVEDVRPFLARSAVSIVPLRIGGGTRLKIFEALSMSKAVVSTSIGAEGLPVRHGEHLLIADDPPAFANAVVSLLRNPERRKQIGIAARDLVQTNYSWTQVAVTFSDVLKEVAAKWQSPDTSRSLHSLRSG
jgi:sugar transferase (PEP-CTERM/EpsH1 system associated)